MISLEYAVETSMSIDIFVVVNFNTHIHSQKMASSVHEGVVYRSEIQGQWGVQIKLTLNDSTTFLGCPFGSCSAIQCCTVLSCSTFLALRYGF